MIKYTVLELVKNINETLSLLKTTVEKHIKDIEDINSSLESKASKSEVRNNSTLLTMADMGQDVKEAMTGGSVAVVGVQTVDFPNLSGVIQEQVGEWSKPLLSWLVNTHYRGNVGEIAVANTSATSYHSVIVSGIVGDFFKVTLKTQSTNQTGIMFVDDTMKIIKKELVGTGTTLSFTDYKFIIPSGATKVILCTYESYANINNFTLSKIINNEFASKKYVNNLFKSTRDCKITWEMNGIGTNGQDNTTVTRIRSVGYYSFYDDVIITPNSGFKYCIFTYDNNKTLLGYDWITTSKTLAINKNYYYRFCIANTNDTTANVSYANEVSFKEYYQIDVANINSSVWKGKKLIIIGDSISDDGYNSALSFVYTKALRDYFGFSKYENYAIASSTIAVRESDPTNRTPLVTRFNQMSDDGDLILISAITNDWFYQWTPIGDMDSRDIYTLYGALHTLCLGLKKKYKGKTVMFLNGIMRRQDDRQTVNATNGLGKSLRDYNKIVEEVCNFYSIPIIDMQYGCGLYPFDDELAKHYFNEQSNVNGLYYTHPNANGQKMMFDYLVNRI